MRTAFKPTNHCSTTALSRFRLLHIPLDGLRDILVDYRVTRGSRSFNKLKSAKNRWRVYRDYLRLPLIPSMKAMACYTFNGLKKYR